MGTAGTTAQYDTHRGYRTRDQPATRTARRTGFRPAVHARHEKTRCAMRRGLHPVMASDSCGVVVVQPLADISAEPAVLLEECTRVLVPGGRLWLLALNPLSPYRWRWRGQGPRSAEPFSWRRRLRSAGLTPDAVTQGLGPTWTIAPEPVMQDGAGLRAAFLLRAEKRRLPLTPMRGPAKPRWEPGMPAA